MSNSGDLRRFASSLPSPAPLYARSLPVSAPGSLERGGVRLVRRDEASSYGWWGNLAVVVGRRSPDATHVQNYRACVVDLHKRYPAGVGLVTLVQGEGTPARTGGEP